MNGAKLLAGFTLLVIFSACSKPPGVPDGKSDSLTTAKVSYRTITSFIEATGDLSPANRVEIKAEVSGRLKKIHVNVGQEVQEGVLLVSLDDTDLLTEKATAVTTIDGAKLKLEKAQRAFDRAKELYDRMAQSKEFLDNARTELELAKNEADRAHKALQTVEDKLKKIFIRSPIRGTVLEILPAEGEVVSGATGFTSGTKIMDIADLADMRVQAHINQVDVMSLRENQSAQVVVEAANQLTLQGEIATISPIATVVNNIKGFKVNVRVLKPEPRARPGMATRVRILLANAEHVLAAPLAAIFSEDEKKFVYVKGGSPEKREVKLGLSDYEYCQIVSGVNENEILLLQKPPAEKKPKG